MVTMAPATIQAQCITAGASAPQVGRHAIPAIAGRARAFAGGRSLYSSSATSIRSQKFQIVRAIAAPPKPATDNGAVPVDFKAWENTTSSVKKRTDIKTIMLLGAGPIVIGQVRTSSA